MDKLLRVEYFFNYFEEDHWYDRWTQKKYTRDKGIKLVERLNRRFPNKFRLVKQLTYQVDT